MSSNNSMKNLKKILLALSAIGFLTLTNIALAEDETIPNFSEDTLTGDWAGVRTDLYKKGIDLAFTHKSDVLSNVSGGMKHGTAWIGHTEAQVTFDLDKLWGWESATAFVHFHSDLGSKFNSKYVGGFVGVDNIEVATNTAQFYQAWFQKNTLNDRLSVLVGLYAVDSEFYVNDSTGVFIQPPYGMANDLAQSGVAGPAVFPLGALAVRLKYTTADQQFYAQAAISDGVPGDPNHPHGTHIQLGDGDGTFSIAEFGYTPQEQSAKTAEAVDEKEADSPALNINKTAIGFWRYTNHLDDITSVDANGNPKKHPSQGVYLLTERTLFTEKEHPSQGLTGFFRLGFADEDVHVADWTSSVGLHYVGLIDGRDDDVAGVAVTVNHASSKYQRVNDANSREVDIELTYRAQITPWLAIQPDVQYIVNPSMDKALKDVTIIGFRTEITF